MRGGSLASHEGGRTGTAGRAQRRLRGGLVAAQIALALVVLAGSGLLMRTFQRLNAVRPGFDPESRVDLLDIAARRPLQERDAPSPRSIRGSSSVPGGFPACRWPV